MFYCAGSFIETNMFSSLEGVTGLSENMAKAAVHTVAGAASGAVNAAITGGDIGREALIGGLSAGVAEYIGADKMGMGGRMALGAATGGMASVISGGDFVQGALQGAWTSAVAYMCNHMMHDFKKGLEEAWDAIKAAPGNAWDAIYNEEVGEALLETGEIVLKTKVFVGVKALAIYGAAHTTTFAMETDWAFRFSLYEHGGGGFNFFRSGVRKFAIDWHKFKINGNWANRPHYHRGVTKSQMKKHRQWQGGW
jgi:hypothetical protein